MSLTFPQLHPGGHAEFLALMAQVNKNLSSPEFVRSVVADTKRLLSAPVVAPAASIASQMTEAQAIAADLHNDRNKAERAIAAHLRRAIRIEQPGQRRGAL